VLAWLGHDVRRANHIGDWGTPFGMLIERLLDVGEAEAAHELSIGDLSAFYRAARAKFDADRRLRSGREGAWWHCSRGTRRHYGCGGCS
jgi:arginyl-tRNA synthetase